MTLKDLVPLFGKKSTPARYDDDSTFSLIHRDMNRLIDEFFDDVDLRPFGRHAGSFSPRVEVLENEKEIRISAELPGLDEKDIEISLSHDTLTIKGEKKEEKESSKKEYYRKERSYGSFRRSISLYSEIDADKVKASFKKGVLKITLPKTRSEADEKKKITVKSG
jgi:HSP20 family protein